MVVSRPQEFHPQPHMDLSLAFQKRAAEYLPIAQGHLRSLSPQEARQ